MGQINKGTIASISGNTARVVPADAGTRPTVKITIPWHLRGDRGKLAKGTAVVYVEFDDFTGMLIERADGEGGAETGNDGDVPIMTEEVAGIAKLGENLTIDGAGRLSVDTANEVGKDNTKPITSAAVHTTVGNIETLLETI